MLALANAHFDPAQVGALRRCRRAAAAVGWLRVVYPDLTRRRLAERLGEEFRSGACHAGRYESSILLAERPELVDDPRRGCCCRRCRSRSSRPRGKGQETFVDAGLDLAYCGDPAAASAEEGRALVAELGAILAEAVRAELG